MNPDGGADPTSPAEEQLLRHLRSLREHPPEPDRSHVATIVKTARWQGAVRPFALAAGRLIAGMGDSVGIKAGRAEA
jgi:hypothetical protein